MAQNKWLWGNFFVGLVDEGREIKPRLQRLAASPPATLWNRERETKPHPQPFAFLVSQASRTATYGSPKREGSS